MGRGGCNCCGDWCTTAKVSPTGGSLQWTANYGDDTFNIGAINNSIYTNGGAALGFWGIGSDGAMRKTPFGSSHTYEVVKPTTESSALGLYLKRLDSGGKVKSAKYLDVNFLYNYPFYWYGWSPYVNNLIKFKSSKTHLHIIGSANIALWENPDVAKYVFNGVTVDGQVQKLTNWQLGWDLLPRYTYNSYNTVYAWNYWWSGLGPLAYGSSLRDNMNSVVSDDTVVMGSSAAYHTYYDSRGISNVVVSFNGVDDNRVYFKAIGKVNVDPFKSATDTPIPPSDVATNVTNTYNADPILNIFPLNGTQVHSYDAVVITNEDGSTELDTSNAQPFARVFSDGSIQVFDTDLTPAYANSQWPAVQFSQCYLSEGAFELYFSLPRNDLDNSSSENMTPENWPATTLSMAFGYNFSYSTTWDQVNTIGASVSKSGQTILNCLIAQSKSMFDGTIWQANVGYYYYPIGISSPILGSIIDGGTQYYRYNTSLVEISQDKLNYYNYNLASFISSNLGFQVTDPKSIASIPISADINLPVVNGVVDLSPLEAYENDPAGYLGIDTESLIGYTVDFNVDSFNAAPYIFNKVGLDGNLYAILTSAYKLLSIKYAIVASVSIPTVPPGAKSIVATVSGEAKPVAANPQLTTTSFALNFNDSFAFTGGVRLDQYVSDILRYDSTNYAAISHGFSPYWYTNPDVYNGIIAGNPFFNYNLGSTFSTSVDNIERCFGQLQITLNEQFSKFIMTALQPAILNAANGQGTAVPIPSTYTNKALFKNSNYIVRDDEGILAAILGGPNAKSSLIYNSNPGQATVNALAVASRNVLTVNYDGTLRNTNFIPHISSAVDDKRGHLIVGAINSSNRVLMSTGNTFVRTNDSIDFTETIARLKLQRPITQAEIDTVWSFANAEHLTPVDCIFLTPEFSDATIDFDKSQDIVLQINGTNIYIPLQSTAAQITQIFNSYGFDVQVFGGPITTGAICIADLKPQNFSYLIDGFNINDSLGKFRVGTGAWPIYGDAIAYSANQAFLRPEQFTGDIGDVLWNFGNGVAANPFFTNFYPWWIVNTFAGFYNDDIYRKIILQWGLDNGYDIIVNDDGSWVLVDGDYTAFYNAFYQDRVKVVAPITEQLGFISPSIRFTSDSNDRISWQKFTSMNDIMNRLVYPEMLIPSYIYGVGSNLSSLYHSGMLMKVMNSVSTLQSKPAALYQVRQDGTIGWKTPFGYQSRIEEVDGVKYEENAGFNGRIMDMVVNDGGNIYMASNMVNLGESKPAAYGSYSEYYNNEILNRADVRHATKSVANPNNDNGQAKDGDGNDYTVPDVNRNTVLYDIVGTKDNPISPKVRTRKVVELPKIVRS